MKNKKRIISVTITSIVITIGYYFLNSIFNISIPCIFYEYTGLYCPGCGITRMLFSILRLDIYQAFRYNPLVFCLIIIFLIKEFVNIILKKEYVFSSKITIIFLIITILFGIARNTSLFSFLAPTSLN